MICRQVHNVSLERSNTMGGLHKYPNRHISRFSATFLLRFQDQRGGKSIYLSCLCGKTTTPPLATYLIWENNGNILVEWRKKKNIELCRLDNSVSNLQQTTYFQENWHFRFFSSYLFLFFAWLREWNKMKPALYSFWKVIFLWKKMSAVYGLKLSKCLLSNFERKLLLSHRRGARHLSNLQHGHCRTYVTSSSSPLASAFNTRPRRLSINLSLTDNNVVTYFKCTFSFSMSSLSDYCKV